MAASEVTEVAATVPEVALAVRPYRKVYWKAMPLRLFSKSDDKQPRLDPDTFGKFTTPTVKAMGKYVFNFLMKFHYDFKHAFAIVCFVLRFAFFFFF